MHRTIAGCLLMAGTRLAPAGGRHGTVAVIRDAIRIGDVDVAPADTQTALMLQSLAGQRVRVEGDARRWRAFLVERVIEPREVELPGVVLQDHRAAGKHLLLDHGEPY